MQGERASFDSLSEFLNFEHSSASSNDAIDQQILWDDIHNPGDNELPDYIISAADTNTTFANSLYHEQHNLHSFNHGEASSSGTRNEAARHREQWMETERFEERRNGKLELIHPLFTQPSSGSQVIRNVNLNAEYNEHPEDMNTVARLTGPFEVNGLWPGLIPEDSVRAGSSAGERRAICKRKARDASIGQSSSSEGFRELQRGESSSWVEAPTFYSPENDLNISFEHGPRGLISGTVPYMSAPAIRESSCRNFSVGVNPIDQQETASPAVFSPESVNRQPVAPSLMPADQQLTNLRYGHAYSNFAPQNPNASPVSRNMTPPSQWSGNNVAVGGPSSSVTPFDRNVIHHGETRQRDNVLENPFFVPAPEVRNLAHTHISRNASGARHVASSSARTSVHQPSPLNPYQNHHSPHNQRSLSEHSRRSLLSSLAANRRAARSLVPPASLDEYVLQSGSANTLQAQNQAYSSRAGPRQGQNAVDVPQSLRELASTIRGRNRMTASEIRNVLDHMRRTRNLLEDAMLRNQSMLLGASNNHDRYRDMRLDVDNMTYEELLSLGERIGDVCTGLNEETISNLLKEHKYKSSIRYSQEVEPCCVCQEEYKEGEEIGKLECGHDFHSQCIKEWLKRKNLCPICKTTGLNTLKRSQEDN